RALVAPDTAVQDESLATLEHPRKVTPAEPAGGGVAARVAQHDGEWNPEAAGRRRAHTDDDARARRGLPRHQRIEGSQPRPILVPHGNEEQRVLDRAKPLLLELARALRPDALDELQGHLEVARRVGLLQGRGRAIDSSRSSPRKPESRERSWRSAATFAG